MKRVQKFNQILNVIAFISDFIILNGILYFVRPFFEHLFVNREIEDEIGLIIMIVNLAYLLSGIINKEKIRIGLYNAPKIIRAATYQMVLFAVITIILIFPVCPEILGIGYLLESLATTYILIILSRVVYKYIFLRYKTKLYKYNNCIFIGISDSSYNIYLELTQNTSLGYKILGYFNNKKATGIPRRLSYLGTVKDSYEYLKENKVNSIYCFLPNQQFGEIEAMLSYCEDNLIRFFFVPEINVHLKRSMHIDTMNSVPIMYIRKEPLAELDNVVIKRVFDFVFAFFALITIFPIVLIIVAIGTTLTSPGPLFFKQKRSGMENKTFWCYKFRSMKMGNADATVQATKDDPRKTKFGNFIRKTSIDELPQFINVIKGEMSVVGPRPHMVEHTDKYSQLIHKYMIRHYVKPGITGWAQVNGFRGETKELSQMEGRVEKDIWYLENWTLLLDLKIIYKTIRNAIKGEENAY